MSLNLWVIHNDGLQKDKNDYQKGKKIQKISDNIIILQNESVAFKSNERI